MQQLAANTVPSLGRSFASTLKCDSALQESSQKYHRVEKHLLIRSDRLCYDESARSHLHARFRHAKAAPGGALKWHRD
jgi:hypothetical protein